MPNLLSGSTFPVPNTAWTLTGNGSISDTYGGHTGDTALALPSRKSQANGNYVSSGYQVVTADVGELYHVSAWLHGDSYNTTPFRATVSDGLTTLTFDLAAPTASGWVLTEIGDYTPAAPSVTVTFMSLLPTGTGVGFGTSGRWLVDDVTFESDAMSKRREIREALVTRIGTVSTGNGYALTLGEVVTGTVAVPAGVGGWPHVQVKHGEETKSVHTIGRSKRSTVTFLIGVFCRADGSTDPDDQCDDACAEIEKAIELGPGDTGAGGQWLGLGYVQGVFVTAIDPEELPPELHRDTRLWVMTVEIAYHHSRREP